MKTTITKNAAAELLKSGFRTLIDMKEAPTAPDWLKKFSPLDGHRPESKKPGKSYFSRNIVTKDLVALIAVDWDVVGDKVDLLIEDGKRPSVIMIFNIDYPMPGVYLGISVENRPDANGKFIVKFNHGELQIFGDGVLVEHKTNTITVVLTPEDKGLALASIYPGLPDEPLNMEGLKEGDILTYEDLKQRNITRVISE